MACVWTVDLTGQILLEKDQIDPSSDRHPWCYSNTPWRAPEQNRSHRNYDPPPMKNNLYWEQLASRDNIYYNSKIA